MFCPTCGKEIPDASSFCLSCGKSIAVTASAAAPVTAPVQTKRTGPFGATGIGLLVLVLVLLILFFKWSSSSSNPPLAAQPLAHVPVTVPMNNKLFTGQIVVKAHGYITNKFTVEPNMQNFRLTGNFNASGGSGNDIQVVLADEDEFQNSVLSQLAENSPPTYPK